MKGRQLQKSDEHESPPSSRSSDPSRSLGKRPISHLRFALREDPTGKSLSTLPPPPFEHETDVAGLEWWLEAHMNLAGGQLCVEQAMTDDDRIARDVASSLETLRDALYEMYCDAADPRMQGAVKADRPLGRYVRGVYAVADEVVHYMLDTHRDLPTGAALAGRLAQLPPLEAVSWIPALELEIQNPLEPLRNLPSDIAELTSAVERLRSVLAAQR